MRLVAKVANFCRNLFRNSQVESDLGDELRTYLEELTERKIAAGADPDSARRSVLIELGGMEQVKESVREQRVGFELDSWFRDARYGFRALRRSPGFMIVTVLSLALGISGMTVAFSFIDPIVLRTLPVSRPGDLVRISGSKGDLRTFMPWLPAPLANFLTNGLPINEFERLRERNHVFAGMFVYSGSRRNVRLEPQNLELRMEEVSGGYFPTLAISPELGRLFTEEDDRSRMWLVVISDRLWQRAFSRDPEVIGKTLRLKQLHRDGESDFLPTVVGVAPVSFHGVEAGTITDVWNMARTATATGGPTDLDWWRGATVMGRLRSGVTLSQAKKELDGIHQQTIADWAAQYGANWNAAQRQWFLKQGIELGIAAQGVTSIWSRFGQSFLILLAAVSSLYVIACANVGGLLLARGARRQKEIAVRLAIGSGRTRLVRQLFTENLTLAMIGGLAGFGMSYWGIRLILAMSPRLAAEAPDVRLDGRVLLFTMLISVASSVLFGLIPAIRFAKADLNTAFKEGDGGGSAKGSRWSMNKVLVMSQIALAMLLLTGAGLFLRTLYNLRHADVGVDRDKVVLFSVSQQIDLDEMLTRITALPGVESATAWELGLLRPGMGMVDPILVDGYVAEPNADLFVFRTNIGPHFFTTTGMSLLAGRDFTAEDVNPTQNRTAIISLSMARYFFGSANPIGRYFKGAAGSKDGATEVIGVAKDTKYMTLRDDAPRVMYLPLQKVSPSSTFAIRTEQDPGTLERDLGALVRQVSPNARLSSLVRMRDVAEATLGQEPVVAISTFAGGFSVLALLLACVGLYGTLSYSVAQRTNEIGIRMALGARIQDVISMLMRETMWIVGVGLVLGFAAVLATTKMISSLLFGLAPSDPLTIAGATLSVIAVTAVAAYLPARRASRVDPLTALRHE